VPAHGALWSPSTTDGTPKGAFFNAIQSLVNTYRG